MTTAVSRNAPLPPHDVAAEEAVIAALLIDEQAIYNVIPLVQPDEFYRDANRWTYEACVALAERGDTITLPTVAHELDRAGRLDQVGGEPWLAEIVSRHFTAIGVEAHARIIARDALYTRLIAAAGQIAQLAHEGGPDQERVLDHARRLIDAVDVSRPSANSLTAEDVIERMEAEGLSGGRPTITTGIKPLDLALAGGFGIGELVTIGARTSVGKTALAVRIAYSQCLKGIPVGYVVIEGADSKILHRMAAYQSGISHSYALRHGWGVGEEETYREHLRSIRHLPIHFAERVPRTPDQIGAWMRRLARSEGVKHFIIDHIDRVEFSSGRDRTLVSAYRDALTRWGNLANEEGCVVTILSQVNRESKEWHPPMSHLRESGAKEELAQIVMMLSQGEDASWIDQPWTHEREFHSQRLGPRKGTQLNIEVAKLTEGRIGWVSAEGRAPLYIDSYSGGVMEVGE